MGYEKAARVVCVCAVLMAGTIAAGEGMVGNVSLNGEVHGNAYVSIVHIVNSQASLDGEAGESVGGGFANSIGGDVTVLGQISERFSAVFCYGFSLWNMPKSPDAQLSTTLNITGGIHKGYAQYLFGDVTNPAFVLKAGYFNYQYSPEAKNLGEYLFRSNPYPGFIISGSGGYNMLGLHLHVPQLPVLEDFEQDVIFHSVINVFPNFDWCLGYVGQYSFGKALTFGAGIEFFRLLPVMPENTKSERFGLVYLPATGNDTTTRRDTLTHAGIKCIARLSFDPKVFLQTGIFGKEDLKLYAEAAILGIRDQPLFYEEIRERIPVMVGFNVPMFTILDYCAVEVEWYGSPYTNNPYKDGSPKPRDVEENVQPGSVDDIKWSVSIGKEIIAGLRVTGRVARDHYRLPDGKGYYYPQSLMARPQNWHWALNINSYF